MQPTWPGGERGKRHNGMQDDSGVLEDEPRGGPPARRQHPKFNSRHPSRPRSTLELVAINP
jgi:hypothetical protein